MIISAIVATANNLVIGKDNQIPWYLPNDLKWFKKNTLNHHIIMGRNTWVSLGRPLPKRTNVIVTRDVFYAATGALITHSISEALEVAEANGESEAFIIGGGQIYEQTKHLWDKVYLTEVDLDAEGDTFFPEFRDENWVETFCDAQEPDERNKFNYCFKIYEKHPLLTKGS